MREVLITLLSPIFLRLTIPGEPDPSDEEPTVRIIGLYGRWLGGVDDDEFRVTKIIYDDMPATELGTGRSSDNGVPVDPVIITLSRDAVAASQPLD